MGDKKLCPSSIGGAITDDIQEKEMKFCGSYYYPLFEFFLDNHGIVLLDSDIQDIINKVKEFENGNN